MKHLFDMQQRFHEKVYGEMDLLKDPEKEAITMTLLLALHQKASALAETINYKDGTINRQKTSYVRLFSLIEIQELLRSASFSIENVWADFMGSEYNDQNSKRIIIRARKI